MINLSNILYFLLLVVIGFSSHLYPPISIAVLLANLKVVIFVVLFLLLFGSWLLRDRKIDRNLFLLGGLFPVFYLAFGIARKVEFQLGTCLLYFSWYVYVFVLSRNWSYSHKAFSSLLLTTFVASLTVLFFGLIVYLSGFTLEGGIKGRFSLGFENPNIYAQYCQLAIISGFILLYRTKPVSKKYLFVYILIALVLFTASIYAQSRNVVVGVLVFFSAFIVYAWKTKVILKVAVIILAIVGALSMGIDRINDVSSGRLVIWGFYINNSIQEGPESIFLGAKRNPDASFFLPKYSRLGKLESGDKSSKKFHADNIYIELFVEAGLIGLLLFFTPLLYMWRLVRKRSYFNRRIWSALFLCFLVQGLFITNFMTFFAPVSLFFGSLFISVANKDLKNSRFN